MTAEIAVMNKEAIALAADSAVTMNDGNGEKVFPSANKIFTLSKYEPVAAMIYGNAHFLGVPWEPAIKLFRHELGHTRYNTIGRYGDQLLEFLKNHRGLFPKEQCDAFCRDHVHMQFAFVRRTIDERVKVASDEKSKTSAANIVVSTVSEMAQFWQRAKYLARIGSRQVERAKRRYKTIVTALRVLIFKGIELEAKEQDAIDDIGLASILKCPPEMFWSSAAGLVVAGFGDKEYFPALKSYALHGIFDGHLHYRLEGETKVSFDMNSAIVPFAQSDMAYTFMEGVDKDYQSKMQADLAHLLTNYPPAVIDTCDFLDAPSKQKLKDRFAEAKKKISKGYVAGLTTFRQERFAQPILRLVSFLPKSELPVLAESMVNLTSLRRKISMSAETVGGPIDVALISKGDGLVWIKRKHYFDIKLNRQFMRNYHRGERHER